MIDSHCHLDHEPLLSDLSNVLKRSKDVGIKKLLTISTSFESFSRIKDIVNKDEIIYGTVGIHPHESDTNTITKNEIVKSLKKRDKSDKNRRYSPLQKRHDSLLINSTRLSITGCFLKVKKIIDRKLYNYGRNFKTR